MDWPLFLSAFLSATLLPGSSEAYLLVRLHDGAQLSSLLLSATSGNLLGSLLTYALGRIGNRFAHARGLGIKERDIERAERWFGRWGSPALLLAWLPVVGDPLCFVAGLLRVAPLPFVLLVGIGKFARYAFLVYLAG